MPIYEQVYRSWQGHAISKVPAWFVIGRTGIRLLWKKSMILLLLLSSIPFFFRAGQIYMVTRFDHTVDMLDESGQFAIDANFFLSFIKGQMFILILVMILAGAGIIANDRKFKALSLYFSKPLGFVDYIAGKFMVVSFYGGLVTFVPALLLFLVKVLISNDTVFLSAYFWIPISLIVYSALILITMGGMVLAVSASARGARSAAIMFFVVMTLPDLFRRVLTRLPETGLISITANLQQAGSLLLMTGPEHEYSRMLSLLVLTFVIALSLVVLIRKVRPVEVVG
jgi:hypothetical protein